MKYMSVSGNMRTKIMVGRLEKYFIFRAVQYYWFTNILQYFGFQYVLQYVFTYCNTYCVLSLISFDYEPVRVQHFFL